MFALWLTLSGTDILIAIAIGCAILVWLGFKE